MMKFRNAPPESHEEEESSCVAAATEAFLRAAALPFAAAVARRTAASVFCVARLLGEGFPVFTAAAFVLAPGFLISLAVTRFPFGNSTARQKYQLAIDRYGRHFS